MSVCIQCFRLEFSGVVAMFLVGFGILSSFSGSASVMPSPPSSLMYRTLSSFGDAGGDDRRRWMRAVPLGGHCSRRSCSTSGMGVKAPSPKAAAESWASGEQGAWAAREDSGSEQLSSDERWLQCESATDGRLPLREGESNSEELVLRCSRSWTSELPWLLRNFPPLLLLLKSFPLQLLSAEPEDSFEQQWPSCCAQQHSLPLEPLKPAVATQSLASSKLLLTLLCLKFSGLGSTSAWTSRLLSL